MEFILVLVVLLLPIIVGLVGIIHFNIQASRYRRTNRLHDERGRRQKVIHKPVATKGILIPQTDFFIMPNPKPNSAITSDNRIEYSTWCNNYKMKSGS